MNDPKQYWIGFNLVKGIGAARLRAVLDYFGDLESAWKAPADAFISAGLNPKIVKTLLQIRADVSLERVWERLQAQGITVLTWESETYPRLLKEIDQPPPVLYLRGSMLPEDEWAVAIVGTRRITAYGRQVAEELTSSLARNGVTVVSGLARGIDSVAHQSALNAGGRTLAVLGSGVDQIYPPENRRLAEQVMDHGALLSDYAPGTPPEASNFPPRNRIISGLSRVIVVVEAGATSGALITAAFAAEQGREVFAVPGTVYAPQSKGANILIQQGARPMLNPQEILEFLNLAQATEFRTARAVLPSDATEAQLYAILGREPLHIDDIRAQSELPIEKVSSTLALMELKGLIRHVGGMQYIAIAEPPAEYQVDDFTS